MKSCTYRLIQISIDDTTAYMLLYRHNFNKTLVNTKGWVLGMRLVPAIDSECRVAKKGYFKFSKSRQGSMLEL